MRTFTTPEAKSSSGSVTSHGFIPLYLSMSVERGWLVGTSVAGEMMITEFGKQQQRKDGTGLPTYVNAAFTVGSAVPK